MKKLFILSLVLLSIGAFYAESQAKSFTMEKLYAAGRIGRGWTKYIDSNATMKMNGRGILGSVALGYKPEKELRIEAEVYLDDGLKSHKVLTGGNRLTIQVKTLGGFVNGYYDFHNSTKFTPFASLGFGWLKDKIDQDRTTPLYTGLAAARRSSLAWSVGAGASYKFNQNISLELSYRFIDRAKRNFKVYNSNNTTTRLQIKPTHAVLLGVRIGF